WAHETHSCPEGIVQLYLGPVKIFSNTTETMEGGTAVIEDLVKEQVAGLELESMIILCGNAALKTHLRGVVLFVHPALGIEVAKGSFDSGVSGADLTRVESELSFLQVKNSMSIQAKVRHVQIGSASCRD
ncbi:MAG: hypothetical protein AN484_28870, partial [Aphanizomenon flos-aquae WA102]